MKTENVVFITYDDLDALLESGVLPRAVINRVVAQGRSPIQAASSKMIEQSDDVPGLYILSIKCVDDREYPARVAVAALAGC